MAQTFQCPNCGAALDYDGGDDPVIRCAYCNSAVIVPEEVFTRDKPSSTKTSSWQSQSWTTSGATFAMGMGSSFTLDLGNLTTQVTTLKEVKQLVRDGDVPAATRLYQQTFSVGAAEADAVVQRLARGESVIISSTTTTFDDAIPTVSGTPYGVLPPTPEAQAKYESIMAQVNEAQAKQARERRVITIGLLVFFAFVLLIIFLAILLPTLLAMLAF